MIGSLEMSVILLIIVLPTQLLGAVSAKPRPPPGTCGEGWLYWVDNGWMYDDNICHDLTDLQRNVIVFKGCKCEFWR